MINFTLAPVGMSAVFCHNSRPLLALGSIMADTEPTRFAQRFRGFFPVVIDVETAGFNKNTDALLEIAVTTLKMDEQGYLHLTKRNTSMLTLLKGQTSSNRLLSLMVSTLSRHCVARWMKAKQ